MVVGVPLLLLLAALLLLSALFAAAEAALLSINKVRLRHLVEEGHRAARLTYTLLTQLDRVIGTLLVANNLINVAVAAIISWVCVAAFGPQYGVVIATAIGVTVLLLIGEVTPKLFATTHPEAVAFAVVRPLRIVMVLLHPAAVAFTWTGRMMLRLLGAPTKRRSPLVTEEELKVMIQMGREAGVLEEHELRMLHRIFEFSDSTVGQVMVPREQIAGVDLNAQAADALDILIEEGHSRIPVYKETIDQPVGVIYARDVLAMVRHQDVFVLQDLIRPMLIVEEGQRVAELLTEFQQRKIQIALVRNPQGRIAGLVTIEDLMEEIVGEIREDSAARRD